MIFTCKEEEIQDRVRFQQSEEYVTSKLDQWEELQTGERSQQSRRKRVSVSEAESENEKYSLHLFQSETADVLKDYYMVTISV